MSKIQADLLKATGILAATYGTRALLHDAIVKHVLDEKKFSDADWNGLSIKSQDWFNAAVDALKAKKQIAEFEDYEPPREEAPRGRGRAAAEPAAGAASNTAAEDLEEGQRVKITHKRRGEEYVAEGDVVEISKRKGYVVVKDADGKEHEVDFSAVLSTEVFHGTASAEAQPADFGPPAVGDTVAFKNKRDKSFRGVVKKLTGEYIELDDGSDCDLDRIEGDIEIIERPKGAEPAATTSTRRASSDEGKRAPADDGKQGAAAEDEKKRSSNPRGVSVGGRVRELLADDPDLSQDDVGKALKKDGIEFRDTSLNMIYKDCQDLIAKLRASGQLKKAR